MSDELSILDNAPVVKAETKSPELKPTASGNYVYMKIQRNEEVLKDLFENVIHADGFVCGGYARLCLSTNKNPVECGDIDIYCRGDKQYEKILARLKRLGYYEKRASEAANTMTYSFGGSLPIQLIKPLNKGHVLLSSENVEDILNNFDFTIARAAITFDTIDTSEGIADKDFPQDEIKKNLRIKNIHCPIAQVYRIGKYLEKGYWCNIKSIIQVFEDWNDRDDDYKRKILSTIQKEEPSKEEIRELEALLHID